MITREDMLRELELLPAWQLREPRKTTVAAVAPASAPEATAIAATVAAPALPLAQTLATDIEVAALPSHAQTSHAQSIAAMDWQSLETYVQSCQACHLAQGRAQSVLGAGGVNVDWLIIGEAPDAENAAQGEPLAGQAAQLLENMLASIQLKRGQQVYMTNVLKCASTQACAPQGDEATQCAPILQRQVELLSPKLIVVLGEFAAQSLLKTDARLADLRGKLHHYQGVPVVVTHHPSHLLQHSADKAQAWQDLCLAKTTMQGLNSQELPPS